MRTRTLLRWRVGRVDCALEFKPADCWIGVFWRTHLVEIGGQLARRWDVWVCLLPMLPLRYSGFWSYPDAPESAA